MRFELRENKYLSFSFVFHVVQLSVERLVQLLEFHFHREGQLLKSLHVQPLDLLPQICYLLLRELLLKLIQIIVLSRRGFFLEICVSIEFIFSFNASCLLDFHSLLALPFWRVVPQILVLNRRLLVVSLAEVLN